MFWWSIMGTCVLSHSASLVEDGKLEGIFSIFIVKKTANVLAKHLQYSTVGSDGSLFLLSTINNNFGLCYMIHFFSQ
jgi:hypothetical protein